MKIVSKWAAIFVSGTMAASIAAFMGGYTYLGNTLAYSAGTLLWLWACLLLVYYPCWGLYKAATYFTR